MVPFRMPGGYLGDVVKIQLTGTDTVYDVAVAETGSELSRI